MITEEICTLQVFQLFSQKCKTPLLQSCLKEFIRFLRDCIINRLRKTCTAWEDIRWKTFSVSVDYCFGNEQPRSKGKTFWRPKRSYSSEKNTSPVFRHLTWYGAVFSPSYFCVQQVFQDPVSYKAGFSEVSTFTKSHIPNGFFYEGDKQKIISSSKLFSGQNLSCPYVKLANSQTLILVGVELENFLSNIARHLRCKHADIPDNYFTLLDAAGISPTLILNQNAKAKEKESWVPFKFWRSEAAKTLHTEGAAFGSLRNLEKASKPRTSMVRQFLHLKPSSTNNTLASRNLKKMKAIALFKNKICCMDLPYVDKQTKIKTV